MSQGYAQGAPSDADRQFIRALVERIRAGRCVLLMGPGVAVNAEREPLTALLARRLAAAPELQGKCPAEMVDDLRYVAQAHYEAKQNLEELALETKDFYSAFQGTTTQFHRNLAELPFSLCISTSPDDLMLEAFRATGRKHPVAGHYNFRKALQVALRAPTETHPLVYYLYGHSDDLYSLVLTESDLIEFLVAMVRGDPALPDHVRGTLGDPDTTYLFVGFGFHHWYLRVLLHVLKIYGHKRSRAVALEDSGFFKRRDWQQTVGFFSGNRAIDFRSLQWDTFAEQLCAAYRAGGPPAAASRGTEPGPDAPRVFLCYASEDRAAVESLGEALEARSIAVWRDKQSLRAGENWDRVLVDVIRKRVDYVVVAQSPHMTNQAEGYFRKEIAVALDRLLMFDQSKFVFVLPVTLPGGSPMPELAPLHSVDVSTAAGVEGLARLIREDWAKPGRRPAEAPPVA